MKRILLAVVLVAVATAPSVQATSRGEARAARDACFDPFEWASTGTTGIKACEKMAGCEVCAAESGAAYGLCTAYCEAMECDEAEPKASETACLKVKDEYIQVTGNPELPCEAAGGPQGGSCWSFVTCLDCLHEGLDCDLCVVDLEDLGCTNVCSP